MLAAYDILGRAVYVLDWGARLLFLFVVAVHLTSLAVRVALRLVLRRPR